MVQGRRPTASGASKKNKQTPIRVHIGRNPISKQVQQTLKYVDTPTVTLSAGRGEYLFSTNGMFDPDITGTGHQPLYFDQKMAMYNHYTVISSTIRITLSDTSNTNRNLFAVLYVDDDTTVAANAGSAAERPGSKSAFGRFQEVQGPTLFQSWRAKDQFGANPLSMRQLQGSASANPAEQMFFALIISDFGAGDDSVKIKVEINYNCILDERKTIAQS